MARFTTSYEIAASPSDVFAVFADLRNAPGRISGIKKLELLGDGRIGVGTRFKETRIMFKKEATETMEITEFTPGKSYTVSCDSCGARMMTRFRFEPSGRGTRVHLEAEAKALTFFAKLFTPLTAIMFGPMMKKCMAQDIGDLKAYIEGSSTRPAAAISS